MTQTLTRAAVLHYYQRLAELSTLPFWQAPDITGPAGPERGHVWRWHDIHPELTRSREIVDDAAALQRRALILRNPGLTPPAVGATATLAASYQMLFPGETAPVHAHSMSALRFGLAGSRRPHDHRRRPGPHGTGRPHPYPRMELARSHPSRR
jgi:gentisate 1,2-dioxygenase